MNCKEVPALVMRAMWLDADLSICICRLDKVRSGRPRIRYSRPVSLAPYKSRVEAMYFSSMLTMQTPRLLA